MKLFETFWTNGFFSSQKLGPKKWQHIMKHNFFSSSPLGMPIEPGPAHMYTRVHASAFLPSRPQKQSCGVFFVRAPLSKFSLPTRSRSYKSMFAELRIGDISHPPLSSCGRVIGEPWKSKILMKGLPYTYRTWSREMCVLIRWIRNHSQIQFPVKNSEPPRNFGTGGRRNSQNKRCVNGTKDINRWSFRCTMSQSWSTLSDVPHSKCRTVRIMMNP